ncbi:MAG: hypothetical protein EVA89_38655 [Sandaracinaceae bacterium]|nr:MAG: hypothetical protein EVA89_38655 [Sandaracinaceae bacterium]
MRFTLLFPLLLSMLLLSGCDDAPAPERDAGCVDCGRDGGPPADAGRADSGVPTMDAGPSDSGVAEDAAVIGSDAAEGAVCGFNRDCRADQRCECDEATGCFCMMGVRGTGQVGVDRCVDENDCASALCVEGPGGDFYCSDECVDASDCAGMLPQCTDIAFVGRICVREPPSE